MLEMSHAKAMDIEDIEMGRKDDNANTILTTATTTTRSLSSCGAMKIVLVKLALNPNTYACVLGLLWALLAKRWHFGMPKIIEGSISIMSKGGAGLAMFSMGLFMALQEKIIACGVGLTLYAMVLRFVVGPVTTAVGAFAMGLHGDVLRIVVIQAALPQALASFVYAQEYGLHAQVLSTAVIFGTVVSLPLLVGYYALLDILG
ncbi:OLC1v1003166C2 [Oldenlandia corymbosa var. corymbosa]|nr:OLC1v1003166C2 [Oldenlandia corymbosa var. corymbosa]